VPRGAIIFTPTEPRSLTVEIYADFSESCNDPGFDNPVQFRPL